MVTGVADSEFRQRLHLALRQALKARDTIATSALRSALAAIDNAGAVPPVPRLPLAPAARTSRGPWPVLAPGRPNGAASPRPT